jgi:hypothetical protein
MITLEMTLWQFILGILLFLGFSVGVFIIVLKKPTIGDKSGFWGYLWIGSVIFLIVGCASVLVIQAIQTGQIMF